MTRREFLRNVLGLIGGLAGLGFLGTIAAYFSPRRKAAGRNLLVSKEGTPIPAKKLQTAPYVVGLGIDGEPTIVVRQGKELRAFSAVCTHLGCLVKWQPAESQFVCPCHGGKFDANGINIAGPPPAPLRRYQVFVTQDGFIGLKEVSA